MVQYSVSPLSVKSADPTIDLYDQDQYHANEKGVYLAACVFYAALYGKSAAGLPSPNAAVGPDAALLQSTAWSTYQSASWSF